MLSAICFNLDQSEILLSGNGLMIAMLYTNGSRLDSHHFHQGNAGSHHSDTHLEYICHSHI